MGNGQTFPDEIWEAILELLDFITIVKCSRVGAVLSLGLLCLPPLTSNKVCKHIRRVIQDSPVLQYSIELGVSGYIDNPRYGAGPSKRLLALTERVLYWKRLPPTKSKDLSGTILIPPCRTSRGVTTEFVGQTEKKLMPLKMHYSGPSYDPHVVRVSFPRLFLAHDPGQNLMLFTSLQYVASF
jgi:hypothetical protein